MPATEGGRGEQSNPSQLAPSPGRWRPRHSQPFGGLQLQSSYPEVVKDLPQTTDVSRKVWGDNNDVIQID